MNTEHFIKFSNKIKENMVEEVFLQGKWIKEENPPYNLKELAERSRIFEITDEIKKLLILTEPPIQNKPKYIRSPYPNIFLDVEFTKEELKEIGLEVDDDMIGLLLFQTPLVEEGKIVGTSMEAYTLCGKYHQNFTLADYTIDGRKVKIVHFDKKDIKKRDFINKFALNFLNFINNPEIKWVEHRRNQKSIERRIRRGIPIISSTVSITLTGKLKKYIDELSSGKKFQYDYRFWVRGHFRDLQHSRYKEKKRIWILPFVKGEGILIEKTYKIKKEKEKINKNQEEK